MGDLQQQLAELRTRMASIANRIDRKYASRGTAPEPAEPALPRPAHQYVEEWLTGEEVETAFGRHFETEKLYERHRRHGSADIGSLADLPSDLLNAIFEGAQDTPCAEWAFLDTETTGLSGGSGTCAFLVGVGRITPE